MSQSTKSSMTWLAALAIVVLAFLVWHTFGYRANPAAPAGKASPSAAPNAEAHPTAGPTAPVSPATPSPRPAPPPGAAAVLPTTLSLDQFKALEHPELQALSPEEAAWLRRHGFPTEA